MTDPYLPKNGSLLNGGLIRKTLYHSSDSIFSVFDKRKITGDRGKYYGVGFYFSDNKEYTLQFGKYLYECEVRMERPFDMTKGNDRELIKKLISSYEFTQKESEIFNDLLSGMNYTTLFRRILDIVGEEHLKMLGYDGIIGWCAEGGREYVVWEPEQVEILNVLKERFVYVRENVSGEEEYTCDHVADHISSITPRKSNIPWFYLKMIRNSGKKFVTKDVSIEGIIKKDVSLKEYVDGGKDRYPKSRSYEQEDELEAPIVIMDGEVLDGYNRILVKRRLGNKTIKAFIPIDECGSFNV